MTHSAFTARRSPLLPLMLALSLALPLMGCGPEDVPQDTARPEDGVVDCAGGTWMHRTELYFGRDRAGGAPVSEDEWQDFVDTAVTPRFPEGLTTYDARGQYLLSNGVLIREGTKVLLLLHEGGAARSADVDALCTFYKERFQQESVLRVDALSCVRFN